MRKFRKLCAFVLVFLGSILAFNISFAEDDQDFEADMLIMPDIQADIPVITTTQIINFKPTNFQGKTHIGYCFAGSVALERSDAWRCQVGNFIYDPCFITSVKNRLICGADPSVNKLGFPLQIIRKLPATPNTSSVSAKPWIIVLADGGIYTPYTGTMPIIPFRGNMLAIKYGCMGGVVTQGQSRGIVDGSIDTSGEVWQVMQIIYSDSRNSDIQAVQTPIAIKTVWQ